MINHLERTHGIWFPKGGTGALVDALENVDARGRHSDSLDTTIERIRGRGWARHRCDPRGGRTLDADVVVSNMDPVHVYRHMLPPTLRRRWRGCGQSMGGFPWVSMCCFSARKRTWPEVAHHTVWFGERYKSLLSDIFHKKVLAEDFSLYVHRPTATDPSFAPEGCDSFYVLCPVPNLAGGQDWSVEGPKAARPHRQGAGRHDAARPVRSHHRRICHDARGFQIRLPVGGWRGILAVAVLLAIGVVPVPQPGRGGGRALFRGRGHASRRGAAGGVSSAKVLDTLVPEAVRTRRQ